MREWIIGKNDNAVSIQAQLRLCADKNEYIQSVELWAVNDAQTRNNSKFLNLAAHKEGFAGIPILIAYVGDKVGDGHNFTMRHSADGEEYASFIDPTAERIVGSTSDDPADIRIEEAEGKTWIVAKGDLWKWYAKEAVEHLTEQGGRMDVSIEAIIDQMHVDGGIEMYESYTPLGITILGDDVMPAVDGAGIKMLSREEFSELKLVAASYHQTEQKQKGVNPKTMSKRLLADLQTKFDGYRVVGASEDGANVCLLSLENGAPYCYSFNGNAEVKPEQIVPVTAPARFQIGEQAIEVDLGDIAETFASEIADEREKREKAEKDAKAAAEEVEEMRKAELARRNAACREAVFKERDEIEALGEIELDSAFMDDLVKDCENGKFAEVEENGEWCGVKAAVDALRAHAMGKQMAKQKAAQTRFHAWGKNEPSREDGEKTIHDLVSKIINK